MSRDREHLIKFHNCRILRNGEIFEEQLWVRDGRIVDPEKIFNDEKIGADEVVDCWGAIISPGYIEMQTNGTINFSFVLKGRPL